MLPRRLYLDNAATSFPKPATVWEAMARYATDLGASSGRGAYAEALDTGAIIHRCRQRLARLFNVGAPEQVIFTLNCTDAINLALKGLVSPHDEAHVICTQSDHNSILRPIAALCDGGRVTQTCVPIDPRSGLIDLDAIRRAIQPTTAFICVGHASNVTGTVQPIRAVGEIAREHQIPFIVDAAQSAGHIPIDMVADHIDLLALPGHKGLLGPLGTGALCIAPGIVARLRPLREGGTGSLSEEPRQPMLMPDRFEPGSHNAIGLVGLEASVAWIEAQGIPALAEYERSLIGTFLDGISDIEGITLLGNAGVKDRVGVFSVRLENVEPHELSAALESGFGVLTRSGLHCAPLAHQALGTLNTGGATRFSFGPF